MIEVKTSTRQLNDYKGYRIFKETEKAEGDTMNYYWLCMPDEVDTMIDIFLSLQELKKYVDAFFEPLT